MEEILPNLCGESVCVLQKVTGGQGTVPLSSTVLEFSRETKPVDFFLSIKKKLTYSQKKLTYSVLVSGI